MRWDRLSFPVNALASSSECWALLFPQSDQRGRQERNNTGLWSFQRSVTVRPSEAVRLRAPALL